MRSPVSFFIRFHLEDLPSRRYTPLLCFSFFLIRALNQGGSVDFLVTVMSGKNLSMAPTTSLWYKSAFALLPSSPYSSSQDWRASQAPKRSAESLF